MMICIRLRYLSQENEQLEFQALDLDSHTWQTELLDDIFLRKIKTVHLLLLLCLSTSNHDQVSMSIDENIPNQSF